MTKGIEQPNKTKKNHQNFRRKGNLQVLGNIESELYQTSGDEKRIKKSTPGEQAKYSKRNIIAGISSKG